MTDYSFMSEHTDLRHIMGVGIAITRGAAASLSFCYSLLLLTMSRNLITRLKDFSVQQYIPLDSHIQVSLTGRFCVDKKVQFSCVVEMINIKKQEYCMFFSWLLTDSQADNYFMLRKYLQVLIVISLFSSIR